MNPEQTETKTLTFELFKRLLYNYVKENFKSCDTFLNGILDAKNESYLKSLFKEYNEEIFTHLGGEANSDLQDEIDDLQKEVSDLESDNEDLQSQVDEFDDLAGNTMNDNFKLQHFIDYRDEYTEWELEDLLKNGKKYLAK